MQDNISFGTGKSGMDRDTHPSLLSEEKYTFALNAFYEDIGSSDGFPMLQNEPSNIKCMNFPEGFKLVGYKVDLTGDRLILFLTNPTTGISEIGEISTERLHVEDVDYIIETCGCDDKIALNEPLENLPQLPICTYNTLITDGCQSGCGEYADKFTKCLNFSLEHPIKEGNIIIKSEKCGKTMYWTDGFNPPRFVLLDRLDEYNYLGDAICGQPNTPICETGGQVNTTCLNCDMMRVFPLYTAPCIKPVEVQYGGNLKAGTYEFLVAYCDKAGNEATEYFSITNPITIFDKSKNILGTDETWARTNLGIRLEVGNLDKRFNYYKVAVIQTTAQDGVSSYFIEGTHQISDTSIHFYTETDKPTISLSKLMEVKQTYLTSEMIAYNNGYLFHGGVTTEKEMNLQPIAVMLGAFLRWKTVKTTETAYENLVNTSNYVGYMRDEVYPFSIVFKSEDGFRTSNYVLVGRPPLNDDIAVVSNTDTQSVNTFSPNCSSETRNRKWQFYNTAKELSRKNTTVGGVDLQCDPVEFAEGTFGYYQSEEIYPDNEMYDASKLRVPVNLFNKLPDDIKNEFQQYFGSSIQGGEIAPNQNAKVDCEPIRHYRFPDFDISPFMEGSKFSNPGVVSQKSEFRDVPIYPIGVYLDPQVIDVFLDIAVHNGLINQAQRNKLTQYEILRGDRTLNKSIIAKGLAYDMYSYRERDASDDVLYSNYPYNDLGVDKLHYTNDERNALIPHPKGGGNNSRFTFHSPDTHFRRPQIPSEIKVEAFQFGVSKGQFVPVDDHSKWVILSPMAMRLATALAIGEAFMELAMKIGDFMVQDSIAGDRIVTGGHWGKVKEKTDKDFTTPSYSLTLAGTTTGVLMKDPMDSTGNITGSESANHDNYGSTAPTAVEGISPFTAFKGKPNLVVNDPESLQYKHTDVNSHRLSILEKTLLLITMAADAYTKINKYKEEWLEIFSNNGQPENFAYYYVSEGWYDKAIGNANIGNMLRGLSASKYLKPGRFRVVENLPGNGRNEVKINNHKRESSLFLSFSESYALNYPSFYTGHDDSRFVLSDRLTKNNSEIITDIDVPDNEIGGGDSTGGTAVDPELEKGGKAVHWASDGISPELSSKIASPYVSLKNYSPVQYGRVESIKWITTGHCGRLNGTSEEHTIFGGDTFITRFSLKRKIPLFLTTAVGLADRTPFNYYIHRNIGHPVYYADYDVSEIRSSKAGSGGFWDLLALVGASLTSRPLSYKQTFYKFDSSYSRGLYVRPPSKFYLYYYGIPQFLVESEINCNTRYGRNNLAENFYPNVGDYIEWTQEKNVPISTDNFYYYNGVFSPNHTRMPARMLPPTFDKDQWDCLYDAPNGVAYSLQDTSEQDLTDPWLIYKPLDFYQFSTEYGKLIDLRGIESTQILGRFENQVVLFNAVDVLRDRLNATTVATGTGGVFASRPVEFTKTDLGYAGTQHKNMVSSEFGHFFVDAKRGHVFNIQPNGKGMNEITGGLKDWFKENLPFKILRGGIQGLTNRDVDNQFKSLGIVMGWDSRLRRLFLTKKDYLVKPAYKGQLTFSNNKFFLGNREISVMDREIFEDVSFTLAYSPLTKTWVSYYSFKPDFYIGHHNYFQTGLNNSTDKNEVGIWNHLSHNNSFQVFYGKRYPFTIEVPIVNKSANKLLASIHYWLDSKRFHNNYDFAENRRKGFNKAWIYNNSQNSGQLNLVLAERNNNYQKLQYPKIGDYYTDILITEENKKWNFNTFYNRVKDELNNIPIWKNDFNQIEMQLNPKSLKYNQNWQDRLRGDWFLLRLTQDEESRYKTIFKWMFTKDKLF